MAKSNGCCAPLFLKHVLIIFNLVFLFAGFAVAGVGIWTLVAKHSFVSLLVSSTFVATAQILIACGVIVVIFTFVGLIGIVKENRCLILIYTFALLVIFLLEIVAGILSYVYVEQVEIELKTSFNSTFVYAYQLDKDKTAAIDELHSRFKCCGVTTGDDWRFRLKPNVMPDSCCRTMSLGCGASDHPSNVYKDGCVDKLILYFRVHLVIIGAVALGLSIVQIFGLILSCCLYARLRVKEDRSYY